MNLRTSYTPHLIEAGCDEVGRGCLAGSVVAAAVILSKSFSHPLLTDSKRLLPSQRLSLEKVIRERTLSCAVGIASNQEVDEINVQRASFLAMHRAITQLDLRPQLLLIDGHRFTPYPEIPHTCIVRGDATLASIAAASILAKVYRDQLMQQLAKVHPGYGWENNVGYPTKEHREAIRQKGITPYHRTSFRLLPATIPNDS